MVKAANIFLDAKPRARAAAASLNISGAQAANGAGTWTTGLVREVLPGGLVRVAIPADDPLVEQVGPADGGVTAVGARVTVLVAGDGRIMQVTTPHTMPDGAVPVATGATGTSLLAARQMLDAAQRRLDESSEELKRQTEEVDGFAETIKTLRENVDKIDPNSPVSTDRLQAGTKLIGGSLIAEDSIGAPKLTASKELWAKIAGFAEVTTDMLTAGKATVAGTAVVGELVGNTVRGGRMEGGVFSLTNVAQTQTDPGDARSWTTYGAVDGRRIQVTPASAKNGSAIGVWTLPQFGVDIWEDGGPFLGYRLMQGPQLPAAEWSTTLTITASTPVHCTILYMYRLDGAANQVSHRVTIATQRAGVLQETVTLPYPPDATAPEGDVAILVCPDRSATLTVSAPAAAWASAADGTMTIGRSGGEPTIQFSGETSLTAIDRTGISHNDLQSGAGAKKISWKVLTDRPFGTWTWAADNMDSAQSGQYGWLDFSYATPAGIGGGLIVSNGWATAPVSGWYLVEASVGFSWPTADTGWAVTAAVGAKGIGFDSAWLPEMTLPLLSGIATRPVATGLVHLQKGAGVCPGFWQNTGSWRPNKPCRFSMVLMAEG